MMFRKVLVMLMMVCVCGCAEAGTTPEEIIADAVDAVGEMLSQKAGISH